MKALMVVGLVAAAIGTTGAAARPAAQTPAAQQQAALITTVNVAASLQAPVPSAFVALRNQLYVAPRVRVTRGCK